MAAIDDISERLEEFKNSGLIAEYEMVVVDDSVRLRIVPPSGGEDATLKSFIVDAFAGVLSPSQIAVERAPD